MQGTPGSKILNEDLDDSAAVGGYIHGLTDPQNLFPNSILDIDGFPRLVGMDFNDNPAWESVWNFTPPNETRWWQWALSAGLIVVGAVLTATGVGAKLGVPMIVAGGLLLASNSLIAAGVDSRTASMITSGLSIAAGIVMLATPFAPMGAAMIGSGIGSIGGGLIAEAMGYDYHIGALIGGIAGSFAGLGAYKINDAVRIANIAKKGSVVIGETMGRVTAKATEIGAGTFKLSKSALFVHKNINKKLGSALGMSENRKWIARVGKSRVRVVNIGIDPTRAPDIGRSKFFLMELDVLSRFL